MTDLVALTVEGPDGRVSAIASPVNLADRSLAERFDLIDGITYRVERTGREFTADLTLDQVGARHGDVIAVGPPVAGAAPSPTALAIRVDVGPQCGTVVQLGPDRLTIGRDRHCDLRLEDPTVSRLSCGIVIVDGTLQVQDLGSKNPIAVDGRRVPPQGHLPLSVGSTLAIGGSLMTVIGAPVPARSDDDAPAPDGRVDFQPNRRAEDPSGPRVIIVADDIAAETVGRLHERIAAERRAAHPPLGVLVGEIGTTRMWRRRATSDQFGALRIGLADRPTWLELTDISGDRIEKGPGVDARVPLTLSLLDHRLVHIGDSASAAEPVLRALLLQACILHRPSELQIAVLATTGTGTGDHARDLDPWRFVPWLPHAETVTGSSRTAPGLVDVEGPGLGELAKFLRDRADDAGAAGSSAGDATRSVMPHLVVVIPDAVFSANSAQLDEFVDLATAPLAGATVVIAGSAPSTVPEATCRAVVDLLGGEFTVDDTTVPFDFAERIGAEAATRAARRLGGYRDGSQHRAPWTLPDIVTWDDIAPPGSDALGAAWGPRRAALDAPVGLSNAGGHEPFVIDLLTDGPHALVVGSSGSGKSEFLRTLVMSLATRHSPADLHLALIDFKSGAAFADLAALPHCVAFVSQLRDEDDEPVRRFVRGLGHEMERRRAILIDHEVFDLGALDPLGVDVPPRLVIVVDEYAQLALDAPDLKAMIDTVTRQGRAFGIHCIVASQQVPGDIAPVFDLRVAFRVADPQESMNMVGSTDAFHISPRLHGRAIVRAAGGFRPVQFAFLGGGTPAMERKPRAFGRLEAASAATVPATHSAVRNAEETIDRVRRSAAASADEPPRRLGPDALPDHCELESFTQRSDGDRRTVTIGLAESFSGPPEPWTMRIDRSLGIRDTTAGRGVLSAIAEAITIAYSDSEVRLVAFTQFLDLGWLRNVTHHLGTAPISPTDDRDGSARSLIQFLRDELERRSGFYDRASDPLVVILVEAPNGMETPLDHLLSDLRSVGDDLGIVVFRTGPGSLDTTDLHAVDGRFGRLQDGEQRFQLGVSSAGRSAVVRPRIDARPLQDFDPTPLPPVVSWDDLPRPAPGPQTAIPIGMSDYPRRPAFVTIGPDRPVFIVGTPETGTMVALEALLRPGFTRSSGGVLVANASSPLLGLPRAWDSVVDDVPRGEWFPRSGDSGIRLLGNLVVVDAAIAGSVFDLRSILHSLRYESAGVVVVAKPDPMLQSLDLRSSTVLWMGPADGNWYRAVGDLATHRLCLAIDQSPDLGLLTTDGQTTLVRIALDPRRAG